MLISLCWLFVSVHRFDHYREWTSNNNQLRCSILVSDSFYLLSLPCNGAYMYMKTSKKDESITEEEGAKDVPSIPVSATAAATAVITENPVAEFVKLREPIPMDQQRELFKWILEEKRKVKPKDPEEKKRIDEEKAILKQFIRAKSIPSI
ncbi:uncharacterized protein LOC123218254 isoform X2 [Mangifera indica]|uniref:uncharacterized protein LOC123218254 isoform X2 n=1 Tax=Mangifera indica TaxID=29780 RepID=UPI001CFC0FCC|nr:uncharacterized protein LOC123218254 isoform X2 [Mangifera indica]